MQVFGSGIQTLVGAYLANTSGNVDIADVTGGRWTGFADIADSQLLLADCYSPNSGMSHMVLSLRRLS